MARHKQNATLRDEVREQNYRVTERAVAVGRCFVIIFLFFYINILRPARWPIALLDGILIFASAYNLFILFYTRTAIFFSVNLTLFSMFSDMVAVAVCLFYTGGMMSPFLFLWYLTLFTSGARFGYFKSLFLQVPMAVIFTYLAIHEGSLRNPDMLSRFVLGLFSLTAVPMFGAIFAREEQYTLTVMDGIHQKSITDRLTGLYNYAFFIDEVRKEHSRAVRRGSHFSVILFDLDHFKKINDTYGHEQGNVMLTRVANILKANARRMDTVARYGGEEFVILMPDSGGKEMEVAERIRRKVAETEFFDVAGEPLAITISGGVATYPNDASDIFELMDSADTGLYKAKNSGRNTVCRAVKTIDQPAEDELMSTFR